MNYPQYSQPYSPYNTLYPQPSVGENYYRQQLDAISRPQQQQYPPFITRPVTSVDEAKASPLDSPLSTYLFTDFANGRIYTKQLANDGTALFRTFLLEQTPVQQQPVTQQPQNDTVVVYRQDLEKLINIEQRITQLEKEWRGDSNESSTSVSANNSTTK